MNILNMNTDPSISCWRAVA